MSVLVLDKRGRPLMPCTQKRARLLLERGRARVHRRIPFVIRLVDRCQAESKLQSLALKMDPGSKVTGLSLVHQDDERVTVMSLMELTHRGATIRDALTQRRAFRHRRRNVNLRHRAPRFMNRTRREGWLAPSLQHRVDTVMSWVRRIRAWAQVESLAVELVRFDMQRMQNPEISGIEYQQGELEGYEVREYLLEKWQRRCAYCHRTNLQLQIEHIVARSRGGSNRVGNLTIACGVCNQAKGNQPIEVFLKDRPELLTGLRKAASTTLRDAAAVNSTRNALFNELLNTGLPVEASSGGQTKFNRGRFGVPKTHALDAACVGEFDSIAYWNRPTLAIKACGRGAYQRTRPNRHGFPRGYLFRKKIVQGFRTGDLVCATVNAGRKAGSYVGRVAIRASGSFNIQTSLGVVQGISHRHCRLLQRCDGYSYQLRAHCESAALSLPGLKAEIIEEIV